MLHLLRTLVIAMMTLLGVGTANAYTDTGLQNVLAQWVSNATKNKVSPNVAVSYVREAFKAAQKWGVDPLLLLAVMNAESNYRASVGNSYGARGLMQVVPRWHRDKIAKRNILHYQTNIDVGAQILNEYLQIHGDNFPKAMHKYSGGAGIKYRNRIKGSYQALRDVTMGWKMENNLPMLIEHRFDEPRRYAESFNRSLQTVAQAPERYSEKKTTIALFERPQAAVEVVRAQQDVIYAVYLQSSR